ncbi:porin [Legionella santicrucis]|uniref:porin n=1 Tax=Legionella santicrucis TaxID=45074 RepID=UPI000731C7D4|nr:porin [Legionella santicrucis]
MFINLNSHYFRYLLGSILFSFCYIITAGTPNIKEKNTSQYGHVIASQDGFGFISNDNQNKLFLHGLYQFDQDAFFNVKGLTINNGASSTEMINQDNIDRFWMRRVRPVFNGTFLKYNDFLFTPDFGQGQTRLFDAIIDLHYFKVFSLRAGKQRSLLAGFDRLRGASTNNTVERGYATMMGPNREYGFVFYGSLGPKRKTDRSPYKYKYNRFNDWFSYELGVLTGTFDNSNPGLNPVSPTTFNSETATLANKAFEVRLFTNPFLNSSVPFLRNLGLGIAGSTEDVNNQRNPPALVSVGQNPIFFYEMNVNGNGPRKRLHPQAFWFLGPFGVFGEWTQTQQTLSKGLVFSNADDLQFATVTNHAAEVQVVYNLTQESFTFGSLNPNRNFSPREKGSLGAFQLIARWSQLAMDNHIFNSFTTEGEQTNYTFADPRLSVQKANTWGIGINWFFNRNIVIMTEYDQTNFIGGCSTGALNAPDTPGCLTAGTYATASTSKVRNRPNERVIMQRFQLSF